MLFSNSLLHWPQQRDMIFFVACGMNHLHHIGTKVTFYLKGTHLVSLEATLLTLSSIFHFRVIKAEKAKENFK